MVERIRQILEVRKLTPTQFADAIGIARPIVSHILSGRNKPSLDVVQRIATAFPDLSLPWLLSGVGAMLAAPAAPVEAPAEPVAEPGAARAILPRPQPVRRALAPALASSELLPAPPSAPEPVPSQAEPSPVPAPAPVPAPVPVAEAARPEPAAPAVSAADVALATALGEPGKAIRRIVFFYQDGTFSAYQPE